MKVKVLCTYDNRSRGYGWTGRMFNLYNIDFYQSNRIDNIHMFFIDSRTGGFFGWRLENGSEFTPSNLNFKLVKYEP